MLYQSRIIQLKQTGASNQKIACILEIDRKTVIEYTTRIKCAQFSDITLSTLHFLLSTFLLSPFNFLLSTSPLKPLPLAYQINKTTHDKMMRQISNN